MDKEGNTTGRNKYEMKGGDHETPMTCKCKAEMPDHRSPRLVDTSMMSRRREGPFSDLLTSPQQSAEF